MEKCKVALPILSTHELARNGARLEYDEKEGFIRNKATNKTTRFIQHAGVYFLQMMVKRPIAGDPKGDFGRRG